MKRMWEINGNLQYIESYANFKNTVIRVHDCFVDLFGIDVMNRLPLYIDNATAGSGYTPVITPVLSSYLIIKLGVEDFSDSAWIMFELAHEMCHYVYYCLYGIDSQSTPYEESICTALSLCFLYEFDLGFERNCSNVRNHEKEEYRRGYYVAFSNGFKMNRIRDIILSEYEEYQRSNRRINKPRA